ncbi:hypothetical protein HMPREF9997_00625 [Corynebacterium durum F0235]|uniref:Uncharacterized protein n=1 Tax=Corynebacterium durum F0235 TaxID=1035195 RepID=L1MKI2_9CORY|nr:hypothetical protein HMPREF9997_00625 [Corynebacterium durum F0235]
MCGNVELEKRPFGGGCRKVNETRPPYGGLAVYLGDQLMVWYQLIHQWFSVLIRAAYPKIT